MKSYDIEMYPSYKFEHDGTSKIHSNINNIISITINKSNYAMCCFNKKFSYENKKLYFDKYDYISIRLINNRILFFEFTNKKEYNLKIKSYNNRGVYSINFRMFFSKFNLDLKNIVGRYTPELVDVKRGISNIGQIWTIDLEKRQPLRKKKDIYYKNLSTGIITI